ncbi:phospholipase D-like domain-containing protein [Deinococcus planocerae]|uniref:phospholipase D-like domain-containing protein n=1 Tax=Deinococcus planocerae TaxID=1737569 RepID=UPI000C7EC36D|nr:phospholipase D-like domain-containing protein [Deinococcus planocerae]
MQRPLARLLLAALAGLLVTGGLALTVRPVLGLIPEHQGFLRAYAGVLVAYLAVSAGFATIGALSAAALPLAAVGVSPRTGPYRVGVSLAVSGGGLVIPVLLLSVVAAVSQEGALGGALRNGSLILALCAAGYGLLSGLVLGLLTVRLRHLWRPALAGLAGALAAGAVCGLALELVNPRAVLRSAPGLVLLVSLVVLTIHLGWGLAVRGALGRLAALGRRKAAAGHPLHAAGRAQVALVATLGLSLLGSVVAFTRTLGDFVTARPADPTPLRVARPLNVPGCPVPTDALERAVWEVSTRGRRPDLSCLNRIRPLIQLPGGAAPGPARSGFDDVGALVEGARHEVLFTTMQWDGGRLNPGSTLAGALARLYARVKADPAAFPDGVRVRVTLGNYPVISTFEWGAEVWTALGDLLAAGVPLSDPAREWRVELGNYAGTFPHSHVKLVAIDGETLLTAGFNYAYGHYPPGHPSGRGTGLYDLGLVARGPVAQDGVNVFDDLWARSKVVVCEGQPRPDDVRQACRLGGLGTPRHPAAARRAVPAGEARAFSLYRREGFTGADEATLALLNAATTRIDLMHVNFSMDLGCIVAVLNPSLCTDRDRLPWMTALLGAMERGVNVRLLTDGSGSLGSIENRVALAYLRREMARRGLPPSRFTARWFPGPVHAKAALIDRRMLVVGSMNLHHSSWTQGLLGLNEAVLATSDPAGAREFQGLFERFWAEAEPAALPAFLQAGAP